LRLSLRREDVPTARLGQATRLGWTSWLGTPRERPDAENLVLDVERVAGAAIG
jgi:predicted component of type VI protein secretion system